jgi:hypothetical protein
MMRRFAQAAVVAAAAMSAPVFAGVMISPQAQADPYPRVINVSVLEERTLPDGTVETFYVNRRVTVSSPQDANLVKQGARDVTFPGPGKASSSAISGPGPNQSPPGPKNPPPHT